MWASFDTVRGRITPRQLAWALLASITAVPAVSAAQEIPTTGVTVTGSPVQFQGTEADVTALTNRYLAGDWPAFHTTAKALIERIRSGCQCLDLGRDHVQLIWVATLPTAKDPTLLSALVRESAGDPYTRVIPGLVREKPDEAVDDKRDKDPDPRLLEVFVTTHQSPSVKSYYVSKPLPDPLLEQIPGVVDKFVGPLFSALNVRDPMRTFMDDPVAPPPPVPMLTAVVRQVPLPEPRASIEAAFSVELAIESTAFAKKLEEFRKDVAARGFVNGTELSEALSSLMSALQTAAAGMACEPSTAAVPENVSADSCRAALHTAVTAALVELNGRTPPRFPTSEGRASLGRLEGEVRKLIDGLKPTVVAAKFTLDNSPERHLSFGLLTSFVPRTWGSHERVKIEGGKVVANDLPRTLQMVVLNYSPWGYQEKTSKRWRWDLFFRPFLGVVFNPDIGVSVGASFAILPNLGVNVGVAELFITRPKDGLTLGAVLDEKLKDANDKPTDQFKYGLELRRDPLRGGSLRALFFGVSYNFK